MGISNLTNDISVQYTDNHSVFRCVELIFILDYQLFPSIVVTFALSPSSEFHLVSLEVGLVLDNFNKPHPAEQNPDSAACQRAAEPARLRGGGGWTKAVVCTQAQYVAIINNNLLLSDYLPFIAKLLCNLAHSLTSFL